jgi:hypothetical protein
MATRVQRLKKLLDVQEQLKSLHETRHAGHLANAAAAAGEAAEIAERGDREGSLSSLFPDVYSRGIANALRREQESRALAANELQQIARATARTNLVERNYRDARRRDEREKSDRELLEAVSITHRKPG